jgi:phosphomannomutase
MDASIFKAYDIRGIYPSQIDEAGITLIGRAYAAMLRGENPGAALKVAVASDMRLSGPSLKEALIQGLLEGGLNVDDIGLASTPTFYFASAFFGYDGGLQVSASHNPKEWNGVKMVRRAGVPVSKDSGIAAMRDMALAGNFGEVPPARGVLGSKTGILNALIAEQSKGFYLSAIKPFKIVIDAANGMGSQDMGALFKELPCTIIPMNFELDGTFPAHEADPMKQENIRDLAERVRAEHADLGIAPDGDADRLFFLDEKGEVVPQPILRGLMARIELETNPGATVAYDVRPGRITKDMIDELGGKAVVTKVGHSLIKETMIKEGAIFGGESSGHYFYKLSYGTFEAPVILVLKLLKFLSENGKTFSEAIASFKRYAHSGEISVKVRDQEEVAKKLEAIKSGYADGTQSFLDGITVEYPDYWFNVRSSNTEPLLRLNMEARDPEVLNRELARFKSSIFGAT